jgi:nucleotidyltransferase/DNA polymerase involved in DNA repair
VQAIIDCNSFYCSCERLFAPTLQNAPIVVLSNNDGCIVSRSDEAKKLGIAMAAPYFQEADRIKKFGIHTFSSNYHLYGDLSWRVMETMRSLLPPGHVEVYSVDEAFVDLHHIADKDVHDFCIHLKNTIETWTGISVSIGAAPNKVLSKVANRLAKKNKIQTNCVVVLDSTQKIQTALQKTPIDDVWGIGYSYSEKLKVYGINTAFALSMKDLSWGKKFLGGITGIKLIRELKGLDVYKRPIHCSDLKREVIHIKDNDTWVKDEDKKHMKRAIKLIEHKNIKLVPKWLEANPKADDISTKKHEEYMKILDNSMGEIKDEDNERNYEKIIRNVAKEILIDKEK